MSTKTSGQARVRLASSLAWVSGIGIGIGLVNAFPNLLNNQFTALFYILALLLGLVAAGIIQNTPKSAP